MKRIAWIILVWAALLTTLQAENFDCSQPLGKMKKFVSCGKTILQADTPLDEGKSLIKNFPESKILSGDLDNDGINDFIVFATEHTRDGMADRIIILKGKPGGGYEDLAKSSTIEYGKADIEMTNHSLYLQVDSNSLEESLTEIYQFKYRNRGFYLIGKEEREDVPDEGKITNISTNYLTGEEIEIDWVNGKKTSETRNKVKRKLVRLEEFSR